jgi:hypothetical protein
MSVHRRETDNLSGGNGTAYFEMGRAASDTEMHGKAPPACSHV